MARIVLLIASALLLGGCQSVAPAASPAPPPLTLAGTSWTVTHIDGKAVAASPAPTVEFVAGDDGAAHGASSAVTGSRVSGSTGCNQYSGPYTQDRINLTVTNLAVTEMACLDDAVAKQETAFTAALSAAATFSGDASGIVVSDKSGAERLRLAPTPVPSPKPLEGTTWELTTFVERDAATSLATGTSISMTIKGGSLYAQACNRIVGPVTLSGKSFQVGELAVTRMACPPDAGDQETRFLEVLRAVTTATTEGDNLTLEAPDGRQLVFAAKS